MDNEPENAKDKILVFIPAYRCRDQLPRVLQSLEGEAADLVSEILVVDNRSPDDTAETAIAFAKEHPDLPIRVVRNKDNYGLGGSHKSALAHGLRNGFDYFVTLHGDDQARFADMAEIIRSGRHHDYDAVLGSRFKKGSRLEGYSRFRTFGNVVFNTIFSVLTFRSIYDLGSGLNMYRLSKMQDRYFERFPDDLTFNYCMVFAHVQRKDRILFHEISWREEDQVSNVKLFRQMLRLTGIVLGYAVGRAGFLKGEHREVKHETYDFEELHKNSSCPA